MAAGQEIRYFQAGDERRVEEIMRLAVEAGELEGTTERDIEAMVSRLPVNPEGRLLAVDDGEVVGVLVPEWQFLAVHPRYRRRGHGRRLVEWALARADAGTDPSLELAVPPHNPGAETFATALGLSYHSSLLLLRLSPDTVVPDAVFPEVVTARSFRAGDDERYVRLVTASFADHRPPITLTVEALRHAHALPGFDPSNILVLEADADADRELVGFCRIDYRGESGMIDFIGVLPGWRGLRFGRELLRWGIGTLRARGFSTVDLMVEGANSGAVGLYERVGFRTVQEWPRWARGPHPPVPSPNAGRGGD